MTSSIASWRVVVESGMRIFSMSPDNRPDALTRGCLLLAAALPWYAVASGVFGLYFYVRAIASQGIDTLNDQGCHSEFATGGLRI